MIDADHDACSTKERFLNVQRWAWRAVDESKQNRVRKRDKSVVKTLQQCLGKFDFNSDFLYDLLDAMPGFSVWKYQSCFFSYSHLFSLDGIAATARTLLCYVCVHLTQRILFSLGAEACLWGDTKVWLEVGGEKREATEWFSMSFLQNLENLIKDAWGKPDENMTCYRLRSFVISVKLPDIRGFCKKPVSLIHGKL